jgi:hypothetical protein
MDRRQFLAALSAVTVGGCAAPAVDDGTTDPSATVANGGFEEGYRGWVVGRDLPTDPNTGRPVATAVDDVALFRSG